MSINFSIFPPDPRYPLDYSSLSASAVSFFGDPTALWYDFLSSNFFLSFQFFLIVISAVFILGIALLLVKMKRIHRENRKKAVSQRVKFEEVKSKRWEIVQKHMASENPAEWKLAVIEADSMLEAMVKKMGYGGSTLGESLKAVKKSDFLTLDDAWKAHKVRNFIAHQGSSFLLSKHQAKEVIRLYEKVFKEFEMI